MKACAILLTPLLAGCATQVWHPTRTQAEQRRDIEICSDHAKLSDALEPVSTLQIAYDCLEQKGYKRGRRPTSA